MRQEHDWRCGMKLLGLFLLAPICFAAVDGTIVNRTSGKPQAGATVTLVQLGAGMKTVASTKTDAKGAFHLDATREAAAPYLLQSLHDGVTYSKMLTPGSAATGIEADVFDASSKPVDT